MGVGLLLYLVSLFIFKEPTVAVGSTFAIVAIYLIFCITYPEFLKWLDEGKKAEEARMILSQQTEIFSNTLSFPEGEEGHVSFPNSKS